MEKKRANKLKTSVIISLLCRPVAVTPDKLVDHLINSTHHLGLCFRFFFGGVITEKGFNLPVNPQFYILYKNGEHLHNKLVLSFVIKPQKSYPS